MRVLILAVLFAISYAQTDREWVDVGPGTCRIEVEGKFEPLDGSEAYMDLLNYYNVGKTLALCKEKCTTVADEYGGTCIAVNFNADPENPSPHCGVVVQGLQTSLATVRTETSASYEVGGKGAQKETLDATHVVQIMPRDKYVCAAYSEPRSTQAAGCDFVDLVFEPIATPDCPKGVIDFMDYVVDYVSENFGVDNPESAVEDLYDQGSWGISDVIDGCSEDVIRLSLGLGMSKGMCECDPEDGFCAMGSASNCGVFEINKWSCPENVCVAPTDEPGYTAIVENNVEMNGFSVTARCAAFGSAIVTVCDTAKAAYKLSGCTAKSSVEYSSWADGCTNQDESTSFAARVAEIECVCESFKEKGIPVSKSEGTMRMAGKIQQLKELSTGELDYPNFKAMLNSLDHLDGSSADGFEYRKNWRLFCRKFDSPLSLKAARIDKNNGE